MGATEGAAIKRLARVLVAGEGRQTSGLLAALKTDEEKVSLAEAVRALGRPDLVTWEVEPTGEVAITNTINLEEHPPDLIRELLWKTIAEATTPLPSRFIPIQSGDIISVAEAEALRGQPGVVVLEPEPPSVQVGGKPIDQWIQQQEPPEPVERPARRREQSVAEVPLSVSDYLALAASLIVLALLVVGLVLYAAR